MKNLLVVTIFLISISLPVKGQVSPDTIYLKNGSYVSGRLIEIKDNQYNFKSQEGYMFRFSADEVEGFVIGGSSGKIRTRPKGLGFTIQFGILLGYPYDEYSESRVLIPDSHVARLSITPMITYSFNNIHSLSAGTGIEFYTFPLIPVFAEYKINFINKKFTPLFYARGGALIPPIQGTGGDDYTEFNTGWSYGAGLGFSLPVGNSEFHIHAGYRYAEVNYLKEDFNGQSRKYQMYQHTTIFNLLDITMGFKF
jgi:hypothetical protein